MRAVMVLALLALAGCRSTGRDVGPGFAPLTLLPLTDAQIAWAKELEPGENRFALNLLGIAAPDGRHAALFGNVRAPGVALRSVLLRSGDGGLSWQETLPPYEQSEVVHVQFIGCTVWALVGWVTEGPGELTLLQSHDCGQKWFPLSEVPKSHWSGWPIEMEFRDTFNGSITLEYTDEELDVGVLKTHDGGRTWKEAPPATGLGFTRRDGVEDRPETRQELQRQVTAADGTQWKLDAEERQFVVRKRGKEGGTWGVVAVLPVWLRHAPGRLAPAE